MSKKGKCFFSLTMSDSSLHCASVGSTPVGFWLNQLKVFRNYELRPDQIWEEMTAHVCASVKQDDRSLGSSLDVGLHSLKVKSDSVLVEVPVVASATTSHHTRISSSGCSEVKRSTHLYCLTSRPESLAIGMWLPHVGVGR